MLGFSPLASKAIADDGIVRVSFNVNDIFTSAPVIGTPTFSVLHQFTSSISIDAPSIDVPSLTLDYLFDLKDIATGFPVVDSSRILGAPALSRVDIDGASAITIVNVPVSLTLDIDSDTDIMLLESRSNVILNKGNSTSVIVEGSDNDFAEVA